MKNLFTLIIAMVLTFSTSFAQTLFTNVNIFDGTSNKLITGKDVLVEKNFISKIGSNLKIPEGTTVIDGQGQTLMPGIIEGHGHMALPVTPDDLMGNADLLYIGMKAAENAAYFIEHGWTTVRDAGGPAYGIKRAIDEGAVVGPRIYNSGMFISQTSGHGDFRRFYDPHPDRSDVPLFNEHFGHIVDGVPEVLQATREELRKGSVHIKVMAGGGIASQYDPLHTSQYTFEEMKAAVDAASDWGTYVMVHAYTDKAVSRAIDAGVKVIEHGQLITEETAKKMAEKGVWLSTQAQFADPSAEAEKFMKANFSEVTYNKWLMVREGTKKSISYAKKYGVKMAFGTDAWGTARARMHEEWRARTHFFSNYEILKQATSINGELLRLTGPLNPYPEGPIGIIETGAYADIILIKGNPLEEISIMAEKQNVMLVMKDGKVYKNTLK